MQNRYSYGDAVTVQRDLLLTDWEVCDLLDLHDALPLPLPNGEASENTHAMETDDIAGLAQHKPTSIMVASGLSHAGELNIIEGNPAFGFNVSYERHGEDRGIRIIADKVIMGTVTGQHSRYMICAQTNGYADTALYRCSAAMEPAFGPLSSLCVGDPDGVFIAEEDWPMFARTILPALADAGIGLHVPQEVAYAIGAECRIEYYLDRDLYGVTCEVVARYGDFVFQLVPAAKELRGVVNPDSTSKASLVKRDQECETLAVQVARQLFPTWSATNPARVREEDEDAILLLITEGVEILKSMGQVFSTAAFDGLMSPSKPSVKVGLSVESNLVEISPIADEVPMNEVGALLDSYRRRRRYHRLHDGTFVDLRDADLGELDRIASDLDLTGTQLDGGTIAIPGYQAFLLDAQVPDERKNASFTSYVNDVKIIDPSRYEVPQALRNVLRPYQAEGFRWLSTLWDKGFGGILADEMGLGKSVQLLALVEARKGNGPTLIVCPASLVYNWAAE
ncbi:MAG: SNF2 helicase associated domain-containing protein, partial [Bifidobacterium sp.]|nr:SNF2 helicase associated domain-containing protein [Bifidobacterium sp.]